MTMKLKGLKGIVHFAAATVALLTGSKRHFVGFATDIAHPIQLTQPLAGLEKLNEGLVHPNVCRRLGQSGRPQ